MPFSFDSLGFGLGYRMGHHSDIMRGDHHVQWFEAITENFLGLGGIGPGPALKKLEALREEYPVVLHGVSLSLGATHSFDTNYLTLANDLFERIEPAWVSDHLCWTGVHGRNSHDLLPLPYTQETVDHVVNRIHFVQDFWQRPLVIENVSSYVKFKESQMSEVEFLSAVVKKSGCKLLLDVNNIYVSARNHSFDPDEYLQNVPWESVVQLHLAGHNDKINLVIDTHDAPVRTEVWELYKKALNYARRPISVMIERDGHIPPFSELEKELHLAREYFKGVQDVQKTARLAENVL